MVKEIQSIAGGTEAAALSSVHAKRKAGVSGGRSSSQRCQANLELFMQEIEALKDAVGLVGEALIVKQARDTMLAKYQNAPKSKATLDDYETALRTEEPFKSRYSSVFFKKNA